MTIKGDQQRERASERSGERNRETWEGDGGRERAR